VFQRDPFNVIVDQNHHCANRESISLEELANETILLCDSSYSSRFNKNVYRFFAKAGLKPKFELVAQDHIGLLGLVALGRGVAISTAGYGCVYAKELKALKLTGTDANLPTMMIWRKDANTEPMCLFRDYILAALKDSAPILPSETASSPIN